MRGKKIEILKRYRKILLECKKIQLSQKIGIEIENKFPTDNKAKQKVLTLFK